MKTKVLSLAAIMFLSGSLMSFASNDTKTASDDVKKECTHKRSEHKVCNPFEGINLTEAQKAQLAAIEKPCRHEKGEAKIKAKDAKTSKKEKACEQRGKKMREYLAKVKAVLTPEQYTTFLENVAVNAHAKPVAKKQAMKKVAKKHAKKQRAEQKDKK